MSDFLNVKDRSVEFSNRIRLNNVSTNVYDVEQVTGEVIEAGTKINKRLFNKLNAVLGYNEVIGTYNSENETVEFETDIDTDDFSNNQRLLVQCMNKPIGPADDVEILKDVDSGLYLFDKRANLKMSNGNIMVIGNKSGTSSRIIILDESGNIIKNDTSITFYGDPQLIEMSDGNIMIVSYYNSHAYITIIDKNATVIKSSTDIGTDLRVPKLIEMSNGNIMIVGANSGTSSIPLYIVILNKNGTVVKSKTQVGSYSTQPKLIEMSDGNIMIVGHHNNSPYNGYITILDQTGNVIKSSTSIGSSFYDEQIIEMSNGNIMIVGDSDGNNCYIAIVNSSGTIVKSSTNVGNFRNPKLIEMGNGNIMIAGNGSATTYVGYITILDSNGNVIKTETSIGDYFNSPQLMQMASGNMIIIGGASGGVTIAIVNKNGDVLKYIKVSGLSGSSISQIDLIETDDSNIFVTGIKPTSTADNYSLVYILLESFMSNTASTINNILLDTTLRKDKYYELVYNETQDKFICEEVRNGNS